MLTYGTVFTCFRLYTLIFLLIIFVLGYQLFYEYEDDELDGWIPVSRYVSGEIAGNAAEIINVTHPVIIWWTSFTNEPGTVKNCGNVKCFFTVNRAYKNHSHLKVFMFYGTDYNAADLPLPRQPHHEWGLLHEESPKNNYLLSHNETMILFNHTSTFRRHSDYPLTTQYLQDIKNLTSTKYVVPVKEKNRLIREGLALVAYVQSDCGTPSDRDHLVQMLQQHIAIDSYGSCLHNKDLPEHLQDPLKTMDHEDFYHHLAQYKFVLALENAVCEDYITEKFWRPFLIGSIPIIYGSPKAKEYLPANNTAIFVDDFNTIEELVESILKINRSDDLYNEHVRYKKVGIQNERLQREMESREWFVDDYERLNFIDGFECTVCRRIHRNIELQSKGLPPISQRADLDHYGCPRPQRFRDIPAGSLEKVNNEWWVDQFEHTWYTSRAALQLIQEGKEFGEKELHSRSIQIQYY